MGLPLRETMLGYGVPELIPHVLPFAFDGGGVMAAFDMREDAVGLSAPSERVRGCPRCLPTASTCDAVDRVDPARHDSGPGASTRVSLRDYA